MTRSVLRVISGFGGTTSRANTAAFLTLVATSHPAAGRVLNVVDGDTELTSAL